MRRFHIPDQSSPFGRGGMNAYCYCGDDPINHADPSGHFLMPIAAIFGGGAVALFGAAGAVALTGDSRSAKFLAMLGGAVLAVALLAAAARGVVRRQSSSRLGEVRIHRGQNKDWLDVHGSSNGSLVGNTPLDGTEMTAFLRSKGLGDKPLVYLSCNSGTGPAPQAQVVADGLRQPVIGFVGPVAGNAFTHRPMGVYQARVFHPQTGLARVSTAIRNTALNRRTRAGVMQRLSGVR
ncbi:hypothetical protein ACIGHF_17065 [Stenotrophomonas sp. NPDC077464]|uniref:hypothetical protein n=1 Tax=unclassified Stenotrophomonas TaxID=196198 RepID=UPI0037D3066F